TPSPDRPSPAKPQTGIVLSCNLPDTLLQRMQVRPLVVIPWQLSWQPRQSTTECRRVQCRRVGRRRRHQAAYSSFGGAKMETGRLPRELLRSGLVLALGWAVSAPALGQSPIVGVWRTMLQSEVMIEPCPEGYCGYLSTIVVPDGLLSGAEAAAAAQMKPEDF